MIEKDANGTGGRRVATTVDGLDRILDGGLIPGRNYMVRGPPGAGKTLGGLHFVSGGEDSLFINLGEATEDIRADAETFGFDLSDVSFLDMSPSADFFAQDRTYDIFPSEEVEGNELTEQITDAVDEHQPSRVFVDPLTQFRYLIQDDYQFRKQVLSFLQYLKGEGCTTLFTSQNTAAAPDDDLQFMSDGIIHLDHNGRGRTVEVTKFRGSDYHAGDHAVRIRDDGMTVYPRLVPPDHGVDFTAEKLSSGVPELDSLLGGGLERGTVTLISGPSGVGKTTLGSQFVNAAAGRDDDSVIYLFEESADTFVHRSNAIGIPVQKMQDAGSLVTTEVKALEQSPEQFAYEVRRSVETGDAEIVMIDGVDGYQLSLRGEDDDLRERLHALTRYCKNMGVAVLLVSELDAVTGEFRVTEDEISYLADNVVFLRYLEFQGELRKAIGVLKKRIGGFEQALREFEITSDGIQVGEPLSGVRGVLSGTPEWTAETEIAPAADAGDHD